MLDFLKFARDEIQGQALCFGYIPLPLSPNLNILLSTTFVGGVRTLKKDESCTPGLGSLGIMNGEDRTASYGIYNIHAPPGHERLQHYVYHIKSKPLCHGRIK